MTNSTIDTENTDTEAKKESTQVLKIKKNEGDADKGGKPKKKKGPFRFEAIIPIIILIGLVSLYGKFMFDSNLKSALEWTTTRIHGAEVNIGSIKTSVFNGTFQMNGLEVTDKDKPTHNLFTLGEIKFQFLWDALLRAKFVVQDAGVYNIQIFNPRKKPGRILPKEETGGAALRKVEEGVLSQSKEQFQNNALGDVASILSGGDAETQVGTIKETLSSEKRIDEISNSMKTMEKEWNDRLASMKGVEEFTALEKEIQSIKLDKKKPWVALKKYKDAINKVKATVKKYTDASQALKRDVGSFKGNFNQLDDLVNADVNALKNRFKIPDVNITDFSMGIFGKLFQSKVASFKKYATLAKDYMPPSKKEKQAQGTAPQPSMVPKKRKEGKNYKFPVTTGYPLFWLKKAGISSKSDGSAFSGDIKGYLTNFSTDPLIVKQPTKLELSGDFKGQDVQGVDVKVVLDNLKPIPETHLNAVVESFGISGFNMSQSDELKFGMKKARGRTKVKASMKEEFMDIKVQNWFSKIDYRVESNNNNVQKILTEVVKDIPIVSLRASANGKSDNLNWNLSSNLGKELSNGIKNQVNNKIKKAEEKIRKMVNDRIMGKKKALEDKYQALQSKMNKVIDQNKSKMDQAKNKLLSQIKSKQQSNSVQNKAKKKGKDLIKNLGKKLKLPF